MRNKLDNLTVREIEAFVRTELAELRRLAPPPRYDIYPFLDRGYALKHALSALERSAARKILKKCAGGIELRGKIERRLVDLTVGSHVKSGMRDKYAKTLFCCGCHEVAPGAAIKFIKAEGGINRCVEKVRNIKGREKPARRR